MIDKAYNTVSEQSEGAKALLFIEDSDSILVTRRGYDAPSAPGLIDLPGGRIEFGETPYIACVREVMEEIGIDISSCPVISADAQTTNSGKLSWLITVQIPSELASMAQPISEAKELIIESTTAYLSRTDAWMPFQNHVRKVVTIMEKS